MCKEVDSVRSSVDELNRMCSEADVQKAGLVDPLASQEDQEVIDWAQLIGRIVDEDIAAEVVPLCVVDNQERLEMLAGAVQAANSEEVKLYAHGIKGSAANIGAVKLSNVAARLEKMAYHGDLSQAERLLDEIKTESAKLESFVANPDWLEMAKGASSAEQPQ